jgi:hypothetical protein
LFANCSRTSRIFCEHDSLGLSITILGIVCSRTDRSRIDREQFANFFESPNPGNDDDADADADDTYINDDGNKVVNDDDGADNDDYVDVDDDGSHDDDDGDNDDFDNDTSANTIDNFIHPHTHTHTHKLR